MEGWREGGKEGRREGGRKGMRESLLQLYMHKRESIYMYNTAWLPICGPDSRKSLKVKAAQVVKCGKHMDSTNQVFAKLQIFLTVHIIRSQTTT